MTKSKRNPQSRKQLPKTRLRIKYVFPDDYNPVYANGAYGGLTPHGEISVNFFFERHSIPRETTHEVDEGLTLGQEISRDPEDPPMIRYVTNGAILNYRGAKLINQWLGKKIEELETRMAKEKEASGMGADTDLSPDCEKDERDMQ